MSEDSDEARMFAKLRERCGASEEHRAKVREALRRADPRLLKLADMAREKLGMRMPGCAVRDSTGGWVDPREAMWNDSEDDSGQ